MERDIFYNHMWQSNDSADDRDILHGWRPTAEKDIV